MSTLHTVNKSPFTHSVLNTCVSVCSLADGLLLIEDGVYGALTETPCSEQLRSLCSQGVGIFALTDDVRARGIEEKLLPEIKLTDYQGFVELSLKHRSVQSWY